MIKLTNLTDDELKTIGRAIGEAFYDEGEGVFTCLDRGEAIKTLEIMTECYYRLDVLYTTSDKQEGYLAYWRKGEKLKMGRESVRMIWRLLRGLSFGSIKKVATRA